MRSTACAPLRGHRGSAKSTAWTVWKLPAPAPSTLAIPTYRTVKGILFAGTDTDDPISTTSGRKIAAVPAFLRGPDEFGDCGAA